MAKDELGLLFFKSDSLQTGGKCIAQMNVELMNEADARRYVNAKMLVKNIEEPNVSSAPPVYFVPLSSLIPLEETLATPLIPEEFTTKPKECFDPECLVHSDDPEVAELKELLSRNKYGKLWLERFGIEVESE